jgi:imidazolonepropionase-like amidohydrolase
MRSFTVLAAACAVAIAAGAGAAEPAQRLLIRAEKVYTAPHARAQHPAAILINGGRIESVGLPDSGKLPAGTQISECSGGFITAGFQNSHVHFTEDVWSKASTAPVDRLQAGLDAMLSRYGFTTVVDTGSDGANTVALRSRIEKGDLRGPRILTVGSPLYPPDGIPSYIRDLPAEVLARMPQPGTPEEARAAVRANLALGVDATKLFLHTSPRQGVTRRMTPEIVRAAVEETHAQGKLVMAHPTSLDAIRVALDAGVDVLVHTTLGEKQSWDPATLDRMKRANTSVIPTFKLWIYELKKEEGIPDNVVERLVGATFEELRSFMAVKGQVLFGTDVGYMHDYDPTDEYVLMGRAGMDAMQILESLTTGPAERWKESTSRGRVEPGMAADLVVLDADPALDLRNFAKVRCVFRAGKLIYASKGSQ